MKKKGLANLRKRLDEIDTRIVQALAERQQTVAEIGDVKVGESGGLRDVEREEDLLSRVVERAKTAGLDAYWVTRLFREILDYSVRCQQQYLVDQQNPDREAQETLVVGYQGTDGAYSHLAGTKHFAARNVDVRYKGCPSFQEMLEALRDGDLDYAVLPIENTTAGSINEAYDLLARMNLALVGEEVYMIDHCLVALEPVTISRIRRIYSHPQALVQCGVFLNALDHCHVESLADTALAAKKLREDQDLSEAAIASEEAARLYGLHIIKRGIANQKENYTRFVIVAREAMRFDARIPCKTSVIFATRHEEGALLACLNVLADHHL
ncbi:MAG: prephenate dehydratase domain-containing protein, partial [Phycisphaerae bacterium]